MNYRQKKKPRKFTAYQQCLRYLSHSNSSQKKMQAKLAAFDYEQKEIDEAIAKAVEQGYLQEELYTKSKINHWRLRGNSAQLIKRRFEQEGLQLEKEKITEVFTEAQDSEIQQIQKMIEKKGSLFLQRDKSERQKIKNKILSALMRKGHSFSTCQRQLEQFLAEFDSREEP